MRLFEIFPGFVLESRKTPEFNKKTSTWDQLQKYRNDPNIFIHFTTNIGDFIGTEKNNQTDSRYMGSKLPSTKLGINPNYSFFTPAGIYAYQIDKFLELFPESIQDYSGSPDTEPYASSFPIIYIIRFTGDKDKLLTQNGSQTNYTRSKLQHDLSNLIDVYGDFEDNDTEYEMDFNGNLGKLFQSVAQASDSNPKKQNTIFRALGYEGINDLGGGPYSQFDHPQAVFFSKKVIKVVDIIRKQEASKSANDTKIYGSILKYAKLYNLDVLTGTNEPYYFQNRDFLIKLTNRGSSPFDSTSSIDARLRGYIIGFSFLFTLRSKLVHDGFNVSYKTNGILSNIPDSIPITITKNGSSVTISITQMLNEYWLDVHNLPGTNKVVSIDRRKIKDYSDVVEKVNIVVTTLNQFIGK